MPSADSRYLQSVSTGYSINDYSYSDYVKIIHTWNIIDEFALFLGIERYDNEKNKSLMNHTVYRQNINPENTYDRLFRVGDLQGEINQRKKIMYKSNKFKKARYDHLQDLMDHQLKFRDKDDNITLKPNQVSYSVMVTENNENYKKRLFSDYQ